MGPVDAGALVSHPYAAGARTMASTLASRVSEESLRIGAGSIREEGYADRAPFASP